MAFLLLQLMDLLFSFLDPGRPHSASLAGYFSKVLPFSLGSSLLSHSPLICDFTWCYYMWNVGGYMPDVAEDHGAYELCSGD